MVTIVCCILGYLIGFSFCTYWHFWKIRNHQESIEKTLDYFDEQNRYIIAHINEISVNTRALDAAEAALEEKEGEIKALQDEVAACQEIINFYRGQYLK